MKMNDSPVFMGVREDDEDVEEEFVKSGITIGMKFSVLHCVRNPSFMRFVFFF